MSCVPAEEIPDWLRLSFATLPTGRARRLLQNFDSPREILQRAQNSPELLREEFGLTEKALRKLQDCARRDVSAQERAMQEHGISLVRADEFPPLLDATDAQAPPFLFVRGEFQLPEDERAIAIVGTRNVTEYGRGLAHRFALDFARAGWTVVSGLARGVDTAAHRGALDGGGRTIAVTGCGLDIVYPSDNRDLMLEIEQNGAVVSEWAPTTPPEAWHFPARNRIIAGLCAGVIVVESQLKSGALITATFAGEIGRPVFAVPGNVHKPQSRGPHQLIKEGALLVESAQEVLDYLASEAWDREIGTSTPIPVSTQVRESANAERTRKQSRPAKPTPPTQTEPQTPSNLSPGESQVWVCLDVEGRHLDDITSDCGLEPGAVNAALVLLEIKGVARRLPGNLFVKVTS